MKECRLAAAGQVVDRTLGHPALRDQFLGDRGNGAALQARLARQVRARNRLVLANQVQHDPPVDIPGGLTRGDLKSRQFNLAHGDGRAVHMYIVVVDNNIMPTAPVNGRMAILDLAAD